MLDSLAVVGLLALSATGELDRRMVIALLVGLSVALGIPSKFRELRAVQLAGSFLYVSALFLQLIRLTSSANVVTLAVEFAALIQVVRLATRRGAAHDQQIIILALLHLIAATILGAGLAYAACFIGFMFLAPVTLLLSHLRREVEGNYRQGARDRAGLPVDVPRILRSRRVVSPAYLGLVVCLSLPMFVFTGLLFVAFPRVGLSLLLFQPPRKARLVGFSDRVDLGVVGKLQTDPSVALRLTYSELPPQPPEHLAVYLRGAALDYYDGQAWSKTHNVLRSAEHEGTYYPLLGWPNPAVSRAVTIELSPIDPPIVFLPADAEAIQVLPQVRGQSSDTVTLFRNSEDELRYVADSTLGLRYRVYFGAAQSGRGNALPPTDRMKYLALPPGLSTRVSQLAKAWTPGDNDPLVQASLIERRLREEYRYDLNSPSGAASNPMEDFLFTSHRGHCEYYATAMAILLRTLGIPTRNVTGFGAATFNRFGQFYVVRQSDAHSWVEAWVDDIGWRRFDPTPPQANLTASEFGGIGHLVRDLIEAAAQRWSRHVESYDMQQQLHLVGQLRSRAQRLGIPHWVGHWVTVRSALLAVVLTIAGVRLARYLRKRTALRRGTEAAQRPLSPPAKLAIQLYQALEQVLLEQGIPRPEGTPPWGYALSLRRLGHPLAEQVVQLTQLYLEVRFGERPLLAAEAEDFQRQLDALRQSRPRSRAA
jgi:transglutaminase-like putative cysteine protease